MDLSRDIRDYLLIKKSISLPGLGSLFLERVGAAFDDNSEKLFPPSFKISFDPKASSDESILDHLSEKYDVPRKDAMVEFNSFVFTLVNQLLNYGKTQIKGIGEWTQLAGEDIQFTESTSDEFSKNIYLPTLTVKKLPIAIQKNSVGPTTRIAATANQSLQDVKTPSYHSSGNRKRIPDWFEYILPFLIAGIIVLLGWAAWKWYKNWDRSDVSTPVELNESKSEDNLASESDTSDQLYSKEDRDDSFLNEEMDGNQNEIKNDDDRDLDNETENLSSTPDSGMGSGSIKEPAMPLGEKKVEDTIEESGFGVEDNTEWNTSSFVNARMKPFHPEARVCVIVVGSFKKENSINSMLSNLSKLNYESFTQKFGEFTRVGVKVRCNDAGELIAHLNQIKSKVEKNAWILH